jgi:hypothetical protein
MALVDAKQVDLTGYAKTTDIPDVSGLVTDAELLTASGDLNSKFDNYSTTSHNHSGAYLPIDGKAANADLLDGNDSLYYATADHNHSGEYLAIDGTAIDSEKLGGVLPSGYSLSTHDHADLYATIDHEHNITDLNGVVIDAPASGQALVFNGEAWVNSDVESGGSGATTLDGLTDVTITNLANNDILRFNDTQWYNTTLNINDITDVDIEIPADGNVLMYTTEGNKWINTELPEAPEYNISDLNDTAIDSPASGESLVFNGEAWVNSTGGGASLDGLTDVTVDTPASGEILQYDGSAWVNASAPVGSGSKVDISQLGQVRITSEFGRTLASRDTLAWYDIDGGAFYNVPLDPYLSINDLSDCYVLENDPVGTFLRKTHSSGYNTIELTTADLEDMDNVVITSPASGQYLRFNGTNWVNSN